MLYALLIFYTFNQNNIYIIIAIKNNYFNNFYFKFANKSLNLYYFSSCII